MGYEWDREESVGGWGYRMELTTAQQAEIDTCLSCPLPDCKGIESPKCPLWQDRQWGRKKRDMQRLISAWWAKTARMGD